MDIEFGKTAWQTYEYDPQKKKTYEYVYLN
jgi:hypothetical protein